MFFTDPMQILMGKDLGGNGALSGNVDLTTVGFRNNIDTPVMEVTATFDALLYLRGRAMNVYDGTSWSDSADYPGEIPNWEMLDWPELVWDAGIVKISTRYAHRMLYTPYYLRKAYMKDAGAGIINKTGMTEYAYDCQEIVPYSTPDKLYPSPLSEYPSQKNYVIYDNQSGQPIQSETGGWRGDMLEQFIRLPDSVRKWAEPLADEITEGIVSPYHKALAIAEYVKNSATYDTRTPRMSGRNKDFARWFLEDSDTGYCVHYASAAAVLLQASGIPARYVTGYTAQVEAGKTTVVTADKAHAWVEYYLPGFGWTVLEATPAAEVQIPTETQQTTQPSQDTQTPTQEKQTSPEQDKTQENRRKYGAVILKALAVVAALAALVAAAWGQYRLRLHVRRRRDSKLNPNDLAVAR
jgi:transglutaminase-like putative cysteine protease